MMTNTKISLTTCGLSRHETRSLIFLETGRGAAKGEAFFVLCERSPEGRRFFSEAVAQYKRGERFRTPEQYIGLLDEIASSCGELTRETTSFAAGFLRGDDVWCASAGRFSVSTVSRDGKVNHLEQGRAKKHLEPGDKLIAGECDILRELDNGFDSFLTATEQEGAICPGVKLELESTGVPEKNWSRERGSQGRRARFPARGWQGVPPRFSALRRFLPRLSRSGWVWIAGIVVVVVLLVVTVPPFLKKRKPSVRDGAVPPAASGEVGPADTTRQTQNAPAETALSLGWKRRFPAGVTSSPTVYEGKVFFGCRDGGLYCLDARTGEQVWRFSAGTGIGASPAVSAGRVFAGDYSGRFWCVDAVSGQRVWEFRAGGRIVSSARVVFESVIFGCHDKRLYCVSSRDGSLRWKYEAAGVIWSSPLVERDRVFFGSVDGTFYCLSVDSAKLLWKYNAGGGIYSSPVFGNGIVCFGSNAAAFHFLDAVTGKELFRIETARDVRASPLMVGEIAYGASDDGVVSCINVKKRTVVWRHSTGGAVRSTPFASGKTLYVTSYDGRLHALEAATGRETASFDAAAEIYSSPFVSDRMVYFGANDGNFYCLKTPSL